jgi:hypothetical protein
MNHADKITALRDALTECLAAYRATNRNPETTMKAETQLDRIRSANEQAVAALALTADASEDARRDELEMRVLRHERDQARGQYEFAMQYLMRILMLTTGSNDIKLPDGRVMRFVDPNAAETLSALGKAITAIPDELRAGRYVFGYVNVHYGTFHTPEQVAATERNQELIAMNVLVKVFRLAGAVDGEAG